MDARKIIWLLLILACAGFFILLFRLLNPVVPVEASAKPIPVVVAPANEQPKWILAASRDLPAAHRISLNDLKWVPVSAFKVNSLLSYIEKGSRDLSELKGMILKKALKNGDLINPYLLLKYGDAGFLALQLSPGKRALSLPILKNAAQAALLSPGDEVDVIMSVEKVISKTNEKELKAERSSIVASKARVLAIDRYAEGSQDSEDSKKQQEALADTRKNRVIVTLEVSAKESTRLALAGTLGKELRLALRRPDDKNQVYYHVRASDLLTDMKSLQPESATVLIRGDKLQVIGGM